VDDFLNLAFKSIADAEFFHLLAVNLPLV
jgi:hypothetical protein